jgi:hypothetical protein
LDCARPAGSFQFHDAGSRASPVALELYKFIRPHSLSQRENHAFPKWYS